MAVSPNPSLAAAKQRLRSLMKAKLASVSTESVNAQSKHMSRFLGYLLRRKKIFLGRHVCEALRNFQPYKAAQRISIYLAMPSGEIQTDEIVRDAFSSGKQVYVPYLHRSPLAPGEGPARVMDMVHLRDVDDYESLQRDRWGIPSVDPASVHERQRILGGGPDAHRSDQSTLDLMLMPGVAFGVDEETGKVRRLGHGRGFYDFFIQRYGAKVKAHGLEPSLSLYGLALTEQLLEGSSEETVPVGPQDESLHGVVLGDGKIVPPATE